MKDPKAMRKICTIILASLLAFGAHAEQRTEDAARHVAEKHITLQRSLKSAKLELLSPTLVKRHAVKGKQQITSGLNTPYYIYNNAEGGFIIVSGSTAMNPVIGYSDSGHIDTDAMPDGLRYWLGFAAEAANYAELHPESAARVQELSNAKRTKVPGAHYDAIDYTKDVKPLLANSRLGNIQFNQNSPYNDQCPTKEGQHCFTGCMATAMAQVMAYHQYPTQPKGWVGDVFLNMETYDWSLVLPTYKGGLGTAAQRAEVAKIHHHVGEALSMNYGTDQSGSYSTMYVTALRDHFCYNDNVALINRDDYTYGEWVTILLNEFNHNRPVLYDGVSSSGGHAFVLDGYSAEDGLFHVNWGWEGVSDGYYDIVLLNPSTTGIGASLSSGFTTYQDAVVGIEPDRNAKLNYYLPIQGFGMQGELSIREGEVDLTQGYAQGYISGVNITNVHDETFSGTFGALITDMDGNEVARAEAGTVYAAAATAQSNPHASFSGGYYTIPQGLADGTYLVYMYVQEKESDQWAVLRTTIEKPNYCYMHITDGKAIFSINSYMPTELKVTEWGFDKAPIQYGSTGLEVTLTNTGTMPEYGTLALQLDIPNRLSQSIYCEFQYFAPGETRSFIFPFTFNEYGTYEVRNLRLNRLNGGGQTHIIEPKTTTFVVARTAAETIQQLQERITEVQDILDKSRLSGNYTDEVCQTLQDAINKAKNTDTSGLTIEDLNQIINELNEALKTFYQKLNLNNNSELWSYIGNNSVNRGWSMPPGSTGYFGISIPEDDLSAHVGGQIVGLNCLFGRYLSYQKFSGNDITCRILLLEYKDGIVGSRVLASSKEFTPTYYNYDNYLFTEPYTIGNTGVLCVAEVTLNGTETKYSTMASSEDVVTPGACWMNNGNGWEDMYYSYGDQAAAHAIRAIIVGGTSVNDAKLDGVKSTSVAVGEDIIITGKVKNFCSTPINSYELSWTRDDGQQGSKTFNTYIDASSSADFSLTLPAFSSALLHHVTLSVSKIDGQEDQIPTNSTVDVAIPVTANKYVRNIVCEEHTGAWCGWCPRGIVTFEKMKEKYDNRFIGVSIHSNDPMQYMGDNYHPLMDLYLSSAPSGIIDRKTSCYSNMHMSEIERHFLSESENCIAQVEAEAYYDAKSRAIVVISDTEFGYAFNEADYRLSYLVLEDQAYTGRQTNYFSGYANGEMGGWEDMPSSARWTYDDVLREQYPAFTGQPGSIPATVEAGKPYRYTYSFPLPATVKNPQNVRIAVLLLDPSKVPAEVINAVQTPLLMESPVGVGTVVGDSPNAASYDLQGRHIQGVTRGIYLQQGRKLLAE